MQSQTWLRWFFMLTEEHLSTVLHRNICKAQLRRILAILKKRLCRVNMMMALSLLITFLNIGEIHLHVLILYLFRERFLNFRVAWVCIFNSPCWFSRFRISVLHCSCYFSGFMDLLKCSPVFLMNCRFYLRSRCSLRALILKRWSLRK